MWFSHHGQKPTRCRDLYNLLNADKNSSGEVIERIQPWFLFFLIDLPRLSCLETWHIWQRKMLLCSRSKMEIRYKSLFSSPSIFRDLSIHVSDVGRVLCTHSAPPSWTWIFDLVHFYQTAILGFFVVISAPLKVIHWQKMDQKASVLFQLSSPPITRFKYPIWRPRQVIFFPICRAFCARI